MKEVYMKAKLRAVDGIKLDKNEIDNVSFGGYDFEINGKSVPFDFRGFSADIESDEKGDYFQLYTAESRFFKNRDIDFETYKEQYDQLGLKNEDITAKFLASATKINEFYFEIDKNDQPYISKLELAELYFIDENGDVHNVNPELLGVIEVS